MRKNSAGRDAEKTPAPAPLEFGVAPRQWSLKAGFSADSARMVSLRELLSKESSTKQLYDLSEDELAMLTVARIEDQREFKVAMVGLGMVDKARAVSEVAAGSAAGRALIAIEKRTVERVIAAARAAANVVKPPPTESSKAVP